ncbi:MAG: hypothetical protein K8S98_05445, partial [Planctomycetes bacterium]|nr:hypothetical protein [Planctomycetota bacterium]
MNTIRRLFSASLALLAVTPLFAASTSTSVPFGRLEEALDSIHADSIKSDVFFIASDELAGRDTPSPGQRVAARFIRSRLERLGWKPGAKDGYLYEWTMDGARSLDEQGSSCTLASAKGEKRLELGRDVFFYSKSLADSDVQGGA